MIGNINVIEIIAVLIIVSVVASVLSIIANMPTLIATWRLLLKHEAVRAADAQWHAEREAMRQAREREWEELKRQELEEYEAERWWAVRAFVPELEVDMEEPTVGELKRALAMPQHQAVRDRLLGWELDKSIQHPREMVDFHISLYHFRRDCDDYSLPKEHGLIGRAAKHEAFQAWLKEIVDPQLPLEFAVNESSPELHAATSVSV